jgi:hypothetical protein
MKIIAGINENNGEKWRQAAAGVAMAKMKA